MPLQMIFVMFAGWVNEHQRAVIAYLQEENRVLREVHGRKRLRFNDDQRRRLAAKGRALGSSHGRKPKYVRRRQYPEETSCHTLYGIVHI